ncbi:type VI secretion system tip protein VgrG [Archangium violaceum]|uniref:type VI secretion system Vgr family protein n=1 Tax=Archangium violaceum TaxID=83451 RepID=UPI00193B3038|nr:type VI secretion system tip protein TssI/VgrG [Archangium violaceum]QRK05075.1 type VI secretion system tip protein VgrG [Archangium violaceum]
MSYTQDRVYLSLTTPLGKDVLLLHGFHGEESLSRPFHFTLELRSEQRDVDFAQVVGKDAAITLDLVRGGERFFHGVVTRFVQAGTYPDFTKYIAELRPWLWLLTLTRDSRIFQDKTVPQILEQLFTEHGFTDFRMELQRSYPPREYCVQHQESTFDFVSRLMEDEGIFYFFEHSESRHTLVLADDAGAHAPCPGPGVARVQGHQSTVKTDDAVTGCELEQQVVPDVHALGDYYFVTPSTRLRTKVAGEQARFEQYEYPGNFTQQHVGEQRGRVRLESHEVRARTLRGQSRVRWFIPGHRFSLTEHDRDDVNGDYVLRWVSHSATVEQYANSFEAFPAATPFRPPRETPRPVMTGVQSARVVGESGARDIWTDSYGRVKVRFPWDREDRDSCWIRVAQSQAGKGWGTFFLPHVGQEVLVTFVDGDPDRPIITGSVYNAEQRVPYPLSAEQTKSTIRGAPSGEGQPNELRFEDKKGVEELYLHARRDMKVAVEQDSLREVGNDDTLVVKKDQIVSVEQGQSLTVGEDLQVKANKRHALEAGEEVHLKSSKVIIEATSGLTLKGPGPGNFITIDASGVSIQGLLVKINSGGSALSGGGANPKRPKNTAD